MTMLLRDSCHDGGACASCPSDRIRPFRGVAGVYQSNTCCLSVSLLGTVRSKCLLLRKNFLRRHCTRTAVVLEVVGGDVVVDVAEAHRTDENTVLAYLIL